MGVDTRCWFRVTMTTPSRGTTVHRIHGHTAAGARRAAHSFGVAWGHPANERRTVTVVASS